MGKFKFVILFIFIISNNFAIIPPKYGIKPPVNFEELKGNIEKYYNTGYYVK